MTSIYVGPFEMSPAKRVDALSTRMISLIQGKGEYTPFRRQEEICETSLALRDAYIDFGTGRRMAHG